jgi:hypothetical protein
LIAAIAKMERRTDMYLSTFRSHIEAMGGQLEVVARFPDGAVIKIIVTEPTLQAAPAPDPCPPNQMPSSIRIVLSADNLLIFTTSWYSSDS